MIEMALLSLIKTMEIGFQFGWTPSIHQAWVEHMLEKHLFVKKEYFVEVSTGLVSHTVSGGNKNLNNQKN